MTTRGLDRLANLLPPFTYGWREVFIPLAIVLHNQHGLVLATAGLAVAACRLGTWVWVRYTLPALHADSGTSGQTIQAGAAHRRQGTSERAALFAGLALILLGFTPEEGPLGLILWLALGLAWPLVQTGQPAQPTRYAWVWLLLGLGLAGPLALGPGAWLLAAGYLLWAWLAGRGDLPVSASAPSTRPALSVSPWLPALFALTTMTWIWLVPSRLLTGGLPAVWIGVVFVGNWLPRLLLDRLDYEWPRWLSIVAALVLAASIATVALVTSPWHIALLLAMQGLLIGVIARAWDLGTWQPETLTGSQALAETLGPVLGVALLLIAGPLSPFLGGAAAALVLAGVSYASSRATRA